MAAIAAECDAAPVHDADTGGPDTPEPDTPGPADSDAEPQQQYSYVRTVAPCRKLFVPPLNFAMVVRGVYRSGYPNKKNFPFLEKLGLKTMVYFSADPYLPDNHSFVDEQGIDEFHFDGQVECVTKEDQAWVARALRLVLDPARRPILIHCNKGNHRTGCVVGCLRRLQRWSMTSIFAEYRRFARNDVRMLDLQFIELFDTDMVAVQSSQSRPTALEKEGGEEGCGGDCGGGGGGQDEVAAEAKGTENTESEPASAGSESDTLDVRKAPLQA
eukprot:m.490501 g.490501  ORF g.490501 m.490501 type:complete len:272 (+) comp28209_c0_seq1:108-923(+)